MQERNANLIELFWHSVRGWRFWVTVYVVAKSWWIVRHRSRHSSYIAAYSLSVSDGVTQSPKLRKKTAVA